MARSADDESIVVVRPRPRWWRSAARRIQAWSGQGSSESAKKAHESATASSAAAIPQPASQRRSVIASGHRGQRETERRRDETLQRPQDRNQRVHEAEVGAAVDLAAQQFVLDPPAGGA